MTAAKRIPHRIAALPKNRAGYPIPKFVAIIDGVPDFRCIRPEAPGEAWRYRKCWICGGPLGKFSAFVVGPMCAINRVSSEPPSHRDCAVYAATACPFLTNPDAKRRDGNMPGDKIPPPGVFIERNPGVTLVWTTVSPTRFKVSNGYLFDIGDPVDAAWFARGRAATRAEVLASIDSGLPAIHAEIDSKPELDRWLARAHLAQAHVDTLALVPA